MNKVAMSIVCLTGIFLSGCAFTPAERTNDYVGMGVDAIDRNTKANIAIVKGHKDYDPVKVAEAEADFNAERAEYRDAFSKISEEIEEEKRQRKAIVTALGSAVIEFLPGGGTITEVAKAFKGKFDSVMELAISEANEKTERVELIANENLDKIDGLKTDFIEVKNNLKEVTKYYASKEEMQKTIDALIKEVEQLNQQEQEKLRVQIVGMAEVNADFKEKFQQNLIEEAKKKDWSEEEIREIGTMSPTESFAAYGAGGAGGIVSLLALLRTLGPSRGKKELDQMRQELQKQQEEIKCEQIKVAKAEQPPKQRYDNSDG